jgi:HEAT repeat protein
MALQYTVQMGEMVLGKLDAEDPNILRAACFLCGQMELAQAERGLLKALGHQVWQVKAEAATALGLIKSKGALPYLRRVLKASEAELRQKVLVAAAGAKAPAQEDEEHPLVLKAVAIAMSRIDSGITQEALLAALNSGQPKLINAALAGLGNLESLEGREQMVECLGHQDASVRKTAAACIGKARVSGAADKLVGLLKDPDAEVRKESIIALNHLKPAQALLPLAACLKDDDPGVRRVAAIALGNTRSHNQQVVDALVGGLKDRKAEVRAACLSALGNCKVTSSLIEVAELMGDTHEDVAVQASNTVVALAQALEKPEYDTGW